MDTQHDPANVDSDDLSHNKSQTARFSDVVAARLSRRQLLQGAAGSAGLALLSAWGMAGCSDSNSISESGSSPAPAPAPPPPNITTLSFAAVGKSLADRVTVPAGYTATVMFRLGDPLRSATPAYRNDGTDGDFDWRAGDHHDGMEYFGLNAGGIGRDDTSSTRGILGINHEALTTAFLFPNGPTSPTARPAAEADKEIAAHGVSFVEVVRPTGGTFSYVQASPFNRRITAATPIELSGPARGNVLMRTRHSPAGTSTRGTLNNCGTGKTPWGTFLTGEENWAGYFRRLAGDSAVRGANKSVAALARYGISQGSNGRHAWASAGADDRFARWDASQTGTSGDGADDYRNAHNTFGYVVEIDPYNTSAPIKKRTTSGRMAHESAAFATPQVGKPLAVYYGDDARNEYMYKFVSRATWVAADANAVDRMAVGDKYLDEGTLYVARYNADGSGDWLPLNMENAAIRSFANYAFADLGDVLINARLAGDAVGATRMDRPEWCSVNPRNNEIYLTLTNNSNRTATTADAANPRAYSDAQGTTPGGGAARTNNGNVHGHIIRMREDGGEPNALRFRWDVYAFGAEAGADAATQNLSGLTADNDFSSPDGLWFSPYTRLLWIQTDDGAYTDVTNCMMLAAIPGSVGDGTTATLNYTVNGQAKSVATYVGARPTANTLKRFLVGPVDCEITGVAETPDGRSLFVNIQHPGEDTPLAALTDPTRRFTSNWPDGGNARPRSATIVISKNDGGIVGT